MTGESGGSADKLSVVVFSGAFEKVHYALVLASAAAAIGTPATLFFTMEACRFLVRARADGSDAWRDLPAGLADDAGRADEAFARRGVATFEELMAACAEMRVRFIVCEMGLRALGLDSADLRDDIPLESAGAVTFLADASPHGAALFV